MRFGVAFKDKARDKQYAFFPEQSTNNIEKALIEYMFGNYEDSKENCVFVEFDDGHRVEVWDKVDLNTDVGNRFIQGYSITQVALMSDDYKVDKDALDNGEEILYKALREFDVIVEELFKEHQNNG